MVAVVVADAIAGSLSLLVNDQKGALGRGAPFYFSETRTPRVPLLAPFCNGKQLHFDQLTCSGSERQCRSNLSTCLAKLSAADLSSPSRLTALPSSPRRGGDHSSPSSTGAASPSSVVSFAEPTTLVHLPRTASMAVHDARRSAAKSLSSFRAETVLLVPGVFPGDVEAVIFKLFRRDEAGGLRRRRYLSIRR